MHVECVVCRLASLYIESAPVEPVPQVQAVTEETVNGTSGGEKLSALEECRAMQHELIER
jgi:hypothetical protein